MSIPRRDMQFGVFAWGWSEWEYVTLAWRSH